MDEETFEHLMKKDAGFGLNPPSSYQMILSLGKTSLESAVFDPSKKKFIAFLQHQIRNTSGKQEYFDRLKHIIIGEELLNLSYKSTSVIWQTQCATLVPMPLYDEQERKTYLQFNQMTDPDDVIYADKMQNADAYNIFAVPSQLMPVVEFLHPQIHNHASVFIESLLLTKRHSIEPMQVFVNVHSGFFDMVVIHDRKLRFSNSFAYATAEDFIYFVLFVFEQLKLLPEKNHVVLSGEIVKDSAIFEILYKYIRNISFAEPISEVANSYILQDIAAYQTQNLFNTILCEL